MRHTATLAIVLALASLPAAAQQAAEPEPILRATIDPPRVVVGQKTTLRVEVLAPNYMTSPPLLPEFQVRNAVTRKLQDVNLTERNGDITYAGVRYEFAIYPQEPGSYAVAGQSITLRYAAVPPQPREATLPLPRIGFEAFIPEAAAQLSPFIAATRLTIAQDVQRSAEDLKVGGSVTRTITIKAEGTPAMLLPPTLFPAVDGLMPYPAQPALQDHIDARTDVLSATRVDTATYMLEKPGDYLLPAVVIRWWNVSTGKVETAQLDTIGLHVGDDPNASRAPAEDRNSVPTWNMLVDLVVHHWPWMLIATVGLAAFLGLLPRIAQSMSGWYRGRRHAFLASEPLAFARLLAAAVHRDARKTYRSLLRWLERFDPVAPSHTIRAFKAAAQDPALDRQVEAIERDLFAPAGGTDHWSARKLLPALIAARRRLLRQASRSKTVQPLPRQVNPVAAPTPARHQNRSIAR